MMFQKCDLKKFLFAQEKNLNYTGVAFTTGRGNAPLTTEEGKQESVGYPEVRCHCCEGRCNASTDRKAN